MSCKVRIDAPHGIVEIEGDPEFVTAFYEKLAPLVDKAHFGIAVSNEQSHALSGDEGHGDADDSSTTKTAKRKKKRANPPPGASCRVRILTLKGEGFFKAKKSPTEIVSGLEVKGWTHTVNQVGAALTPMFNKGEIQRTKDGTNWVYFWDRD
jgi:hypothetical protein